MHATISLLILMTTIPAFAEKDPFAQCELGRGRATQLNCKISVANEYIQKYLGRSALRQAEQISKEKCSHTERSNLDTHLLLLSALQCELDTKIEFYENYNK